MRPAFRAAFILLNDSGPVPTYIHIEGHRYMLVSHAADQMLAAIDSAERAERERFRKQETSFLGS